MKIHNCIQGGSEWLSLRAGVVTASELGNLLTDKFAIRKGEMPETYLAMKLAEKWTGGPLPGFTSFATEQGNIVEEEAVPWLAFEYNLKINRVGFITTDDGRFGASPDALIGDSVGLEVKSPMPVKHVKNLLGGVAPEEHLCQIHGGMYATGFQSWRFLSYRRGFPNLYVTVERDEEIIKTIDEAVQMFNAKLDAAWKRLCEINGGEPERVKPSSPEPIQFTWEQEVNQDEVTP